MAKVSKPTQKRGHKIGDRLKGKRGIDNPYAVGMAAAKKAARKRKQQRARKS